MKVPFSILFLFSIALSGLGQAKLLPKEAKISDPELQVFLSNLKQAIAVRDKEFIIKNMSSKMKNSFDGDNTIEEFKRIWKWDSNPSEFWTIIKKIVELGGGDYKANNRYYIPYIFSEWPGHEIFDAYEHMAITGTNVNVRDKPSLKQSEIIGQLNYDIVKTDFEKSYPKLGSPKSNDASYIGEKEWYYIETVDGALKGYVNWNYIWSPIDYRLGIDKVDGKWIIAFLVAGD
jgi:hypothetical protein